MRAMKVVCLSASLMGGFWFNHPAHAAFDYLSGSYAFFMDSRKFHIAEDLASGDQHFFDTFWSEQEIFDFSTDGTTLQLDKTENGTENEMMIFLGYNWLNLYSSTDTFAHEPADNVTGVVSAQDGNIAAYNVTETDAMGADTFKVAVIATEDQNFFLESGVSLERGEIWSDGDYSESIDSAGAERNMGLKRPDGALSVADVSGRYRFDIREHEDVCGYSDEFGSCQILNRFEIENHAEVIFNGDGTCTIPYLKSVDYFKKYDVSDGSADERLFVDYEGDTGIVYAGSGFVNAHWVNVNSVPQVASEYVTNCTYSVTNNRLDVAVTFFDTVASASGTGTMSAYLSDNCRYARFGGFSDDGLELNSVFGMRMHNAPSADALAGRTYIGMAYEYYDTAFDLMQVSTEPPVEQAGDRFLISFAAGGVCSIYSDYFDMWVSGDPVNGLSLDGEGVGNMQNSCTYEVSPSNSRIVTVTHGNEILYGRFSDDYALFKFGLTEFTNQRAGDRDWAYEVDGINLVWGIGINYVGSTPQAAGDLWFDTQYWLDLPVSNGGPDFNGDRKADILLRHTDGTLQSLQMNGHEILANATIGPLNTVWTVAGVADFNGDNKTDILLRHSTGTLYLWEMDGTTIKSSKPVANLNTVWSVVGVADFSGDGKADILLRHDSGTLYLWQMNGATIKSSAPIAALNTIWSVAGVADFSGDGKADLLLRHSAGTLYLWQMNGATIASSAPIAALNTIWTVAGAADFSGEGKADILLRHATGTLYLWQMNGATIASSTPIAALNTVWNVETVFDYNGDGQSDILLRHDGGTLYLWQMDGKNIESADIITNYTNEWSVQ